MKRLVLWCGSILFWLSWPALWLYLRRGTRTRLLLVVDTEFLALRGWLGGFQYGMPGGGVHKREAPSAALLREVREETGVELDESQLRHAFKADYRRYGLHFTYDCYAVVLADKPTIRPQRKEIAEYAWLPLDTPAQGLGPELTEALAWWNSQG